MRNRHFLLLDVLLLAGLPFVSLGLRFESFHWTPDVLRAAFIYAAAVLVIRVVVAYYSGLYRCIWRHASITELQRILYAGSGAAIASLLLGTVGLTQTGISPVRMPYSVLAMDALFALGALATPRLLARVRGMQANGVSGRRAIVVGAGAAGQLILR